MTKTFTQNDLIRYIYSDVTDTERTEIEQALACETELLDEYHKLLGVVHEINNADIEPAEKTVQNILNYSKSLNSHSL